MDLHLIIFVKSYKIYKKPLYTLTLQTTGCPYTHNDQTTNPFALDWVNTSKILVLHILLNLHVAYKR